MSRQWKAGLYLEAALAVAVAMAISGCQTTMSGLQGKPTGIVKKRVAYASVGGGEGSGGGSGVVKKRVAYAPAGRSGSAVVKKRVAYAPADADEGSGGGSAVVAQPIPHGGGGSGGGGWSDSRLKRDVRIVGRSPSGLTIYAFRYIWGGPEYVGVMAQDLLSTRPDAIVRTGAGFLWVDYDRIDVEMMLAEDYFERGRSTAA